LRKRDRMSIMSACLARAHAAQADEDYEALDQLLLDIMQMYPPGQRRQRWLAWLDEVAAEAGHPGWRIMH
jgi:hypothetical protein